MPNSQLKSLLSNFVIDLHAAGLVCDQDLKPIPESQMHYVYMAMLEESDQKMSGMTGKFVGWVLGKGYDVTANNANHPRSVALALVDLLRPYCDMDADIEAFVNYCDEVNKEYITDEAIQQSGATNVHKLH